jgi:2-octaprenylphenol hydroxylase
MKSYDIAIVGAGLVGQAIAAALIGGKTNLPDLKVALIDPAEVVAPAMPEKVDEYDLRVSALTAKTQAFLSRLGAWQQLPEAVRKGYTSMHVWDADGTGSVTFNAADLHVPALGHIVENNQTLWALQQVTAQAGNIDMVRGAVQSFDNPDAQGYVPVTLNTGEQLQARLLVGADGALSNVRQMSGIATREWDYEHRAIVATVRTERSVADTAWQRFRPEGPLAFLPVHSDDHLASIVWSTVPEEADALLAMDDEAFMQALTTAFEGRLGQITEVSPRQHFPLRQRHAKRYYEAGVVVAGDAAHTIHPLAGQGVNLGFKDAEVLAEEILRGVSKGLSPGSDAVLGRYQRRRQADNLATMAAMEGFKRLFGSDQLLIRLLRNEGLRLFDRALPVKQHVVMKAMGLS